MVEMFLRMRAFRALASLALLGAWLPLQAATPALGEVASPDGNLRVEMALDNAGRPTWRLLRQGREVIAPSPLGMVGEGADLSRGLALAGVDPVQPVVDDYELLSGKRRHNQYRANRRVFRWKDRQGHELAVAWQVSNDGAAFRYELARAVPGLETWKRDAATFRLSADTHAWLQPLAEPKTGFGRTNPSYEEYYLQDVPVGTPAPMGHGWVFPALFRSGGDWILLSEGSLRRGDAGSRLLDGATRGEYLLGFPDEREALPGGPALPWIDTFPWRSPWRIVAVGDLATVADSTLGTDLADPPAVAAPSVPGKASWSWPLLGDESTVFEVQKQFVDYAARMGWRYTLVDALWDTQIGEPKMRELIEYARGKGVSVLVWYNSAGDWNQAPQTPRSKLLDHASRAREFGKLKAMGVAGLKVDFFGGDGSSMIAYYLDLLADSAPYGFQMNFHGSSPAARLAAYLAAPADHGGGARARVRHFRAGQCRPRTSACGDPAVHAQRVRSDGLHPAGDGQAQRPRAASHQPRVRTGAVGAVRLRDPALRRDRRGHGAGARLRARFPRRPAGGVGRKPFP
jgi:Glycoside hydrolase 97.